jgi:hypothetical protein
MQQPAYPTPEQRYAVLMQKVHAEIGHGARVQSQDWTSAVLVYGKPVNHVLHAILTVFLLGLWLFVWIPVAILGGERREQVIVDEWGRVLVRKV